MTKNFLIPNGDNSSFKIYKVSGSDQEFFLGEVEENYDFSDLENLFLPLETKDIFFRNHRFPFANKKRIEKIINFELEPYLPFQKESYSFFFNETDDLKSKNQTRALCFGTLDSKLDNIEKLVGENHDKISGIVPYINTQVKALVKLNYFKKDAILISKDFKGFLSLYAISSNNIIGVKKVGEHYDINKIVSSIKILNNYVKLAIDNNFSPESIDIIDTFDLKENVYLPLRDKTPDNLKLIDNKSLEELINIKSQEDTGLVLYGFGLYIKDIEIFRKKNPGLNKFVEAYKKEIIVFSAFFAVTFILLCFQIFSSFSMLKQQELESRQYFISQLRKNFPGIKRITPSSVDQAKIIVKKAKEKNNSSKSSGINHKKLDILRAFMDSVPRESVELEKITIMPVATGITGIADGYDVIDRVKKDLMKNKIIKNADIAMANTDKSGKIRFRLEIELNE